MIFYELELLSVPEFLFACSVQYAKHKNQFFNMKDYIELSLIEQGRMLYEHFNGEKETVCPGMLAPILSDISCNIHSYKGEIQQHTTVGVRIKYNLKKYDSKNECDIVKLKERMKNRHIILIPYCCYLGDIYNKALNIIKKISALAFSDVPPDRVKAISQWYLLTGILTEFVYDKLNSVHQKFTPSEILYVTKATQYISSNYTKRLTVKDISEHIGLSEGYLQRIFKKVKGMGVSEYINKYRISIAINLMNNKNLSLKEAGFSVGIEDPAYMSRMFKKTTGMSYRDYFKIK